MTQAAGLDDLVEGSVLGRLVTRGASPLGSGPVDERRQVPVAPALAGLLPGGALQRGTVVTVTGSGSLVLALLAEASAEGAWCAEVGTPEPGAELGMVAAGEAGVVLERFVRVPSPGERWPEVVAALLDGFDLVVVHPWVTEGAQSRVQSRVQPTIRRLTARVRERGAVVVATFAWEGAALGLTVTAQRWHGLGVGHGYLAAREVEVTAVGRGAAVRPRRARLWLPGADGRVAPYQDGLVTSDEDAGRAPLEAARLAG